MDLEPLYIDLNADVGEGIGNEALIMPYLSSCSIACGGHAGNEQSMLHVLALAKKHHIKVGAHPSFPDKVNFGRIKMKISFQKLFASLLTQIENFNKSAKSLGLKPSHIKPHGALYNLAAVDEQYAQLIVNLILKTNPDVKLYAPYHSRVADLALKNNIKVCFEGFADRAYNEDLSLVSRSEPHAVIENSEAICERVLKMIQSSEVMTASNKIKPIKVDTICVHGDTKNAIEILTQLHGFLVSKHIQIG